MKKTKIFRTILVVVLICTLASLNLSCTQRPSEKILTKSLERFEELAEKKAILHEQYKLTFNDAFMDHTKDVYEDTSGTVKIKSPTFELIRTVEGDEYYFFGHNTKNDYFDRFEVEKKIFEHHESEVNIATLLNSYISRGITMYTAYGPKLFWQKLLGSMSKDEKVVMKTTKSTYELSKKMGDGSNIKLTIDKKSLLPTKIVLQADAKKQHHGSQPYSKVTLIVTKRDMKSLQKSKNIFDMTIPEGYKVRDLLVKKHEHKQNMEEMGCINCHTGDISVTRYEKNKLNLF